jgi:hypothetical protein
MPNESKHIEFQKKLVSQLNGALNNFICSVHKGFTKKPDFIDNAICIYGLNISIYLKIGNTNDYRIYSLYFTQETQRYYENLWNEYLKEYNGKFSKFDDDDTKFNGWFDNCNTLEIYQKKTEGIAPYVKDNAEFVGVISDSMIMSYNDDNFIHVDNGWIKFLQEKSIKIDIPFNLQWTASFLHESNTILEYPEWYVSCYLLADIDNNVNSNYKQIVRPAVNKLLFSSSLAFHELLIAEKQQDIHRQATRAAISQVMARNMSHNIGSHVLSKYKSLEDLTNTTNIGMNQFIPISDLDN